MQPSLAFDFDLTVTMSVILSIAAFIFAWFRTRAGTVELRLKDGADRMDRHEGRISRLEQSVGGLPAQADIHSVQLSLSEMRGDLREMRASMTGNNAIMLRLETIVTRHEDHLLAGKAR